MRRRFGPRRSRPEPIALDRTDPSPTARAAGLTREGHQVRNKAAHSAGRPVCLHDRLGDPPPLRNLVTVVPSPLADCRGLLASRPGRPSLFLDNRLTPSATGTTRTATASLARGRDEPRYGIAQL